MLHISGKQDRFYYADTTLSIEAPHQLVWVSLGMSDNKPEKFWLTFLDALAAWNLFFAQAQRQAGFPTTEEKLQAFLADLAKTVGDSPLVLEINNCHRIHVPQVKRLLKKLKSFQATGLFVLLLSIEQDGDMDAEVDIQAYKYQYFSEKEELDYYLNNGIDLDDNEFKLARAFTAGWSAAVVRLAQQYLLANDHAAVFDDFDAFILHWIQENYAEHYDDETGRLFVYLILMDEIPIPLFQELSEWDKQETVKIFESSPFLRLNQKTNQFYLCKHLRDYLLRHRHLLDAKEQHQILVQLGDWYWQQGETAQAIQFYRRADASNKILKVLLQWKFPVSRDNALCYLEAVNTLPASFLEKNLLLYVLRGYYLCALYRYGEAETQMEEFCLQHDQGEETPEDKLGPLGEAYLLWTYCAIIRADADLIAARYKRAAELLPNGSTLLRSRMNRYADTTAMRLPSPQLGSVEKCLRCSEVIDVYSSTSIPGGEAGAHHLAQAEYAFYQRNFKNVTAYASKAIYAGLEGERYDVVCSAYFLLMRYHLAKGNYNRLQETFGHLQREAKKANYDTFFSMPDLAEAWFYLKLGKRHKVAEWIVWDKAHDELVKPFNLGRDMVTRCGYFLQNHSYREVLAYADVAVAMLGKRGYRLLALQVQLMKAFAHNNLGQQAEAVELLKEVYRWIHGNNLIMLPVEHGSYTVALIAEYQASGDTEIPAEWLAEVHKKARSYQAYVYTVRKKYQQEEETRASVLEKLSSTEQKMLLMLTEGLTFREIAEQQYRSQSAVRTMMHYVYSKIGASGKADAIRIATECGIKQFVMW